MKLMMYGSAVRVDVQNAPDDLKVFKFCHHMSQISVLTDVADFLIELESLDTKLRNKQLLKVEHTHRALQKVKIRAPVQKATPRYPNPKRLYPFRAQKTFGPALIYGYWDTLHLHGSKVCTYDGGVAQHWQILTLPGEWRAQLTVAGRPAIPKANLAAESPSLVIPMTPVVKLKEQLQSYDVVDALAALATADD